MVLFLTIVHVVVCLFLIVVVLLQSGKAADLAGAFGGMGSQTAFGPRGAATLLSKSTTGAAILFMVTSISLGILQGNRGGVAGESVIERTGQTEGGGAPAPVPGAGVQDLALPAPGETKTIEVTPEAVVTPTEEGSGEAAPAGEAPPQ